MMTRALGAALTLLALSAGTASAEKVKFEYWYGLSGDLGEKIVETCNRFNAAQSEYEIVCVGQGGYAQAVQNTIAAFRAGKHPTIVQSYDAGTADLMLSGEFYPVQKMMADYKIDVDWANYFPGISNYYASSKGELFSMPFNSSTAVMYYNVDDLKSVGMDKPPATWEEFEATLKKLKESGKACPYAYSADPWVDLEQFSMAHNVPVASNNNGYDGLDTKALFNTTIHVKHMENIKRWKDEGLLQIRTAQGGINAQSSFAQGECSFYANSIAGHATVSKTAKEGMNWSVTMLPVYEGTERHNTVVGGASLWVLSKKTEAEYRGAAAYLKFLATPESEEYWSTVTGYIPVTKNGFQALKDKGFYAKAPFKGREVALESLTFTEPGALTRGIRLGGFIQIRSEWQNEVEAALSGQKTMKEALDTAAKRSDAVLEKFARTYKGKSFP